MSYHDLTDEQLLTIQRQMSELGKSIAFEMGRNDEMRANRAGEMSAYYDGKAAAWFDMLEYVHSLDARMQSIRIERQRK